MNSLTKPSRPGGLATVPAAFRGNPCLPVFIGGLAVWRVFGFRFFRASVFVLRPSSFALLLLVLCAGTARGASSAPGQPSASATVTVAITVTAPTEEPPPPDNNGCNGPFWLSPLPLVYSEGKPGTQVSQGLTLYSLSNKTLTFTSSVISPILDDGCAANLSCAPWSQVAPTPTTLGPMASRPLTLKYTIPTSLSTIAYFFGRIDIAAKDSQGASAGSLQRFVVIHNTKVKSLCSKLDCQTFTCGSDHGYARVAVTCVNSGNQYLTPTPTGCLRDPKGVQPTRTISLTPSPVVQILPQCQLGLTGSLGLDVVSNGDYLLEVDCDYDGGSLSMTAPAHVSTVSGTKTIALTGSFSQVQR